MPDCVDRDKGSLTSKLLPRGHLRQSALFTLQQCLKNQPNGAADSYALVATSTKIVAASEEIDCGQLSRDRCYTLRVTNSGDEPLDPGPDSGPDLAPGAGDAKNLAHFVRFRQLNVYEQGMARLSYAYGVDVRRSHWLTSSSVGNALVRAVDRAWPDMSATLMRETLDGTDALPAGLLRRISRAMSLLRAPLPALRRLRDDKRRGPLQWPRITPLGATHGSANWLVLDVRPLCALTPEQQDFVIGAGLGHLQCEHAIFFAAHLLAAGRGAGISARLIRRTLTPWSRVMAFSADRAGMLSCGSLEHAISALHATHHEHEHDPRQHWLPSSPKFEMRKRALEEFARAEVFQRLTALRRTDEHGASLLGSLRGSAPPQHGNNLDSWSLAKVDRRLTGRLNLL